MNWLNKLLGKRETTFSFGYNDNETSEITASTKLYGVAWDAVDRVATSTSSLDLLVKDQEKVIKHEVIDLLNNPHSEYAKYRTYYQSVTDLYKAGCCYFVLIGNISALPSEIRFLEASKVSPLKNGSDEIESMLVASSLYNGTYTKSEGSRWLNQANQFVELVRIESYSGKSILNALKEEISILNRGLALNSALLANGGKTSVWVNWKDGGGQDEIEARIASIKRTLTSSSYGGVTGTTGDATITEMGLRPRDMDFAALQQACARQIYLACGVPLPLVFNDAATDNNVRHAKEMFFTDTVIPMGNLLYGQLGKAIFKRIKKPTLAVTIDENKLLPIQEMRTNALLKTKEAAIYTVNELRAMSGLEPIQNGDRLLVNANQVPLDILGSTTGA
jgi:HK97 family phage portal protein